jgi:hypothetical protein
MRTARDLPKPFAPRIHQQLNWLNRKGGMCDEARPILNIFATKGSKNPSASVAFKAPIGARAILVSRTDYLCLFVAISFHGEVAS